MEVNLDLLSLLEFDIIVQDILQLVAVLLPLMVISLVVVELLSIVFIIRVNQDKEAVLGGFPLVHLLFELVDINLVAELVVQYFPTECGAEGKVGELLTHQEHFLAEPTEGDEGRGEGASVHMYGVVHKLLVVLQLWRK